MTTVTHDDSTGLFSNLSPIVCASECVHHIPGIIIVPRDIYNAGSTGAQKSGDKGWKCIYILLIKLNKKDKFMLDKLILPFIFLVRNGNTK
jgi:hypothetical protein